MVHSDSLNRLERSFKTLRNQATEGCQSLLDRILKRAWF
ncbi:hypothetical protein LEP1GSC038_1742 [Leptospira weilii str. 2006001855]|uniref:Uncharacterized protein n=1 Tax=Leptospira weilii str. 2006001855 TaxID=996804 RepID=M6FC37_9LEPT|nr:hypothetical protein LEP1GSC038_1742 [Leptospira weilii str. 2006001855]